WRVACLADAERGKDATEPWRELVHHVREVATRVPPRQAIVLQHGPEVDASVSAEEGIAICHQIIDRLGAGRTLGRVAAMFKPQWQAFLRACRVDGRPPQTTSHF